MAAKLHHSIADPKRFAALCDAYLVDCKDKDKHGEEQLITIVGLALWLDCDKGQLSKWLDRFSEPTEHDPDMHIAHAIKRVKQSSEAQLTQNAFGKRNAMALALGKCMHGWIEQQHVKVEGKVSGSIAVVSGVPVPESE